MNMNKLSMVGRVFTPVAMVVFLSYEITRSQDVTGLWYYAVLIGSITTAVGFEVVGILSGHAVEGFSRSGDNGRLLVALLLMVVYTAAGIFILRSNPILVVIPVVAAIVYLVSALVEGLEEASEQERAETESRATFDREQEAADREVERAAFDREQERATFDREQEAADREVERQERLARAQSQEETDRLVALAKVESAAKVKIANAKARETKAKAQGETSKVTAKASSVSVETEELSGKALEIYNVFRENPGATNTQVGDMVGVSRQYVGQVRRELNGALK